MGEKCCLCIPLDCGVKLLAIISILGTMSLGVTSYMNRERESNLAIFLPFTIISAIMSLIWICALVSPSESTKKMAFLGYVSLILVGSSGYYAYLIWSGKTLAWLCSADSIGHMN